MIVIQITNPAEYASEGYQIESREFGMDGDCFAVPAWEERGLSDLCGPFKTKLEAEKVLKDNEEYLKELGYSIDWR